MKTINELRKAIKPLGFKVSVKSLSYGQHATFIHIESGENLNFNVFTPESLKRWRPLFDWIKEHNVDIQELREETGIYGLKAT